MTEEERFTELEALSLNLLDKIFDFNSGKEYRELRKEFPENTRRIELTLRDYRIKIIKQSQMFTDNSIEAIVNLIHENQGQIGWFSIVWNEEDIILDDFFVLE